MRLGVCEYNEPNGFQFGGAERQGQQSGDYGDDDLSSHDSSRGPVSAEARHGMYGMCNDKS